MFVSIGHDGGDFPATVQTTHRHLQTNNTGMNKWVAPGVIPTLFSFFFFFKSDTFGEFRGVKPEIWLRICATSVFVKKKKQSQARRSLPVSYVAGVKLQLVIISQQALLHITEIHRLPVDEHEAHAPLKGHSLAPAVLVGAA